MSRKNMIDKTAYEDIEKLCLDTIYKINITKDRITYREAILLRLSKFIVDTMHEYHHEYSSDDFVTFYLVKSLLLGEELSPEYQIWIRENLNGKI